MLKRSLQAGLQTTVLLVFCLLPIGCGVKEDPIPCSDEDILQAGEVRYLEHLQPAIEANCLPCHSSERTGKERFGAPANKNFNTREGVMEHADAMVGRAVAGTMPPDGQRMSIEVRCALEAWGRQGYPYN